MIETTNTTHQTEDRPLPEADADRCPICDEPFKPEDLCAEDISEGTCHAACLEGSPVVDLDTGEELPDGEFDTYRFSEVMDPPAHTSPDCWTPWQGGEMPIAEGTAIEVILRYGKQAVAQAGSGYASRWSYDGRHGDHDDIVFYRLVCPTPSTHVVGITNHDNSLKPVDPEDEAYEIGKRDGYSEAVQQIDQLTGGDGEYRYCTDHDPDRHTPGPAEMIQRIVDRFETLNLLEDATKTGSDQPDDGPSPSNHVKPLDRLEEIAKVQKAYYDLKQREFPCLEDFMDEEGVLNLPADIGPLLQQCSYNGRYSEADWWFSTIQKMKAEAPSPQTHVNAPDWLIERVENCILSSNPAEFAGLADHAAFEAGQDNAIANVVRMLRALATEGKT